MAVGPVAAHMDMLGIAIAYEINSVSSATRHRRDVGPDCVCSMAWDSLVDLRTDYIQFTTFFWLLGAVHKIKLLRRLRH